MTDKTFEEKFPGLWLIDYAEDELCVYWESDVEKHCLDKQRHEELMEQALEKERQRVLKIIDKYTCCDGMKLDLGPSDLNRLFKELGL